MCGRKDRQRHGADQQPPRVAPPLTHLPLYSVPPVFAELDVSQTAHDKVCVWMSSVRAKITLSKDSTDKLLTLHGGEEVEKETTHAQ